MDVHDAASPASPPAAPIERRSTARRVSDLFGWLMPLSLLGVAIVSVPMLVMGEAGLPRWRALRAEHSEVEHENDRMRREVAQLRVEVDRLRDDPEAIERIARDELGMVRDDELLFQFEE
jgi:cell division protein FtsB